MTRRTRKIRRAKMKKYLLVIFVLIGSNLAESSV